MSESTPRHTSRAEGFRTAEEIAALRPQATPRQRAPRKTANPALRQVTNGIVCFCGERFSEAQALDFMKHLRAEMGYVLNLRERNLERMRQYNARRAEDSDYRAARSERGMNRRGERTDRARERYQNDPEYRERKLALQRKYASERRASDPEYRERMNRKKREQRARRKAAHGEA